MFGGPERCLRCSTCGISYPPDHVRPCQVCGGKLDGIAGDGPDPDWADKVAAALAAPPEDTTEAKVYGWRMRTLIFAGAPVRDAEHIARDRTIDLHQAEKVYKEAGPELAGRILL